VGSGEHQGFEAQPAAADATPAAMAGAEDQLAEQIAEQASYWVHQKTQNAELTLDQGGRPVEVRVALTGDQAHVSLRSDQLEARQLLDAGREQLQDMLQRQGLQLAGMTVGAGGGHGAGARQEGREAGYQGAQRASVQAALPVGTAARGSGVGERSVDIFV
jgi:flagellar hook-length control protein FliK